MCYFYFEVLNNYNFDVFINFQKYYELKQYKFALKLIKQILSNPKCNEHGGTAFAIIYYCIY